MRQLLLLRHARALADPAARSDRDRQLSPDGWVAAGAMRRAMGELGLAPDLVLVSTARRTMQTLAALEPWDDTPLIEPLDQLYLATRAQLTLVLNAVAETVRGALVIGHNPGLEELASALAGGPGANRDAAQRLAEGFPTAALAEFAISGSWRQLTPSGARLVRFLRPRDLRGATDGA
jgi:phosphohistidine phosphatase